MATSVVKRVGCVPNRRAIQCLGGNRPFWVEVVGTRIKRDIVCDYAVESLADPDAVLVIDETGFLKQGRASCGVGRQYTGSAGKITNCQIGVFISYVSCHGHAFIDRALYLPKSWTEGPVRLASVHVPTGTKFATKPALAVNMIERAIKARVPFSWVAADYVYGVGDIEMALRRAGKGYVLGVNGKHHFGSWAGKPAVAGQAEDIATALEPGAWKRLSAGEGTKGARLHDWAYLELADLDGEEYDDSLTGLWTRGLLIRRNIADGDLAFFTTWCPAQTAIETLVKIEGRRWAIEDSFETAKNELGLDHNETRSWHGWNRHVCLVMLAFAMMAAIRRKANAATDTTPQKTKAGRISQGKKFLLIKWSIQEIRRTAIKLAQRQIQPAHIIAWSTWRRAHQAAARQAHINTKMQL